MFMPADSPAHCHVDHCGIRASAFWQGVCVMEPRIGVPFIDQWLLADCAATLAFLLARGVTDMRSACCCVSYGYDPADYQRGDGTCQ